MRKRIFASLLSLCLLVGLFPTAALAAEAEEPNWTEVGTVQELQEALTKAGATGSGNSYIKLTADIQFEAGAEWTAVYVNGYNGADIVTLDGCGHSISGLPAPLFSGGFAGGSGIIIENLTIEDSNIVSKNTQGSGAFIECVDSMDIITLDNCHLKDSTLSGSRTGGLIGWTAGYSNQNDGAVKTYVTIKNCSVIGCEINNTFSDEGATPNTESVGAIIGHAGASAWTYTTIENCTVSDNTLSGGEGKTGVILGTANVGVVTITGCAMTGNTVNSTVSTGAVTDVYGRAVLGETGVLRIDGKVVEGEQHVKVAEVSINGTITEHQTLAEALNAANNANENATVIVTLLEDIDLSDDDWASMTLNKSMTFTLEGNNKTITGLNAPLFKKVNTGSTESVTIQNLTIKNPAINVNDTDAETSAGALIGWHEAHNSDDALLIKNCHVSGGSIAAPNGFTGGLVGYSANESKIEFENCSVKNVTLSSGGSIGAIIGHAYNAEIDECVVSGNTLNATRSNNNVAVGTVVGCTNVGQNSINVTEEAKSTIKINEEKVTGTAIGTNLANVTITGGAYHTDPTVSDLTWGGTTYGNAVAVLEDYVIVQRSDKMYVLGKTSEIADVTLKADKDTMSGGGTVTLTVGGVPAGLGFVVCNNEATELTYNNDGTWTAKLPNVTNTYTFSVEGLGENKTDSVEVSVTHRSSSSGGSGSSTYAINVDKTTDGSVTASSKSASKNSTVTLTVKPDTGYELDKITVTDKDGKEIKLTDKGDGKYTFTMPASKVDVTASFSKVAEQPTTNFMDVPADAYYADAVAWAVENDITNGMSSTVFAPNGICTRAQAVTFLWRTAGCPAPKDSTMPFTDVAANAYYHDAVLWAVEQGITIGTSATTFSPDMTCSRAHIVTFLWRADGEPAQDAANPFTDVAADAYYASAVTWAVANGITVGVSADSFAPDSGCTRGQIVTFLYRTAL